MSFCAHVLIVLVLARSASSQGKPIVINLGPLMDSDLGLALRDLSQEQNPLEVFEDNEQLFRGLMDHFGGHLLPAMESGARGFQTEVKGDHFKLRGSLPGYSMHRSSSGDEPLNVQVAGRTLVVQGTKSTGNMMTSFQRSFPLPWEPDEEHVGVTYSAQDGALLVDVARKSGDKEKPGTAPEDDLGPSELPMALLAPQMTMAFSDLGRRPDRRSRGLRGLPGLPMIVGNVNKLQELPLQDPFQQFWNDLQEPVVIASPVDDQLDEKVSTSTAPHSPVVLQPKNAKPFWRLSSDPHSQFIDIVSPPGVELAKVQGNYVEYVSEAHGRTQRLEMPVSVRAEDCMQNHMSSQEHVLRCHTETVKNLRINVIDEL